MTLGQALREEIERQGITHWQAAEIIGVSQQNLSKWVLDQYRPRPEHLPYIARFLRRPLREVRQLRANTRASTEDRLSRVERDLATVKETLAHIEALLEAKRRR